MAKILKDFKPPKRKAGRRPLYPWAKWLDGKTRRLVKGTDFNCELATMDDNARKAADVRGLKVHVWREPDNKPPSLVLQSFKVNKPK